MCILLLVAFFFSGGAHAAPIGVIMSQFLVCANLIKTTMCVIPIFSLKQNNATQQVRVTHLTILRMQGLCQPYSNQILSFHNSDASEGAPPTNYPTK